MKKVLNILFLVFLLTGIATINSCKKDPVIPTLTTSAVSNITLTTATSGGVITQDGRAEVTARGVCWGTATKPTITGSKTTDGKGVGTFTSSITGLTPNTMYYVRAYATNSAGTAYGNEVSFTTNPIVVGTLTTTAITAITSTTAVSGGNITADGGGAITARGVCWNTSTNPSTANSKTTDGTGTGSFVSNLITLLPGTTYYVKAYATNSAGTAYGNELTFKTASVVPTLTTTAVTGITTSTATTGGNITSDGGSAVTARGVCWGTTTNPTVAGSHTTDGTGIGSFTSSLTGLSDNTIYYVRSYATNGIGTAYGNEVSFTTSQVVISTLTTAAVTSITSTTAVSGGNITADGGGAVTARGVCWATTANPTISNSKTTDGTGTGSFASNLAGLLPGTTYYVKAYATNSAGTAYGNELTFTTAAVIPTLTTTAVSGITITTATSGGNITNNGGAAVTARGVCWSTSANPVITGSHTSDGTGNGSFTSSLTGLTANTTYYVRAYATNSVGPAYGNEVSFTTTPVVLATLTTTAVTSITSTTAVSGGNITADGGGAITARGVCWSISTNPTITDSHTSDATGTGSFTSNLTGLSSSTTYYVRAYATNSAGTNYGSQVTFKTTLTDVEGNVYNTVTIGTQVWMAENLKSTKYNDNTSIPNVTDNTAWINLTTAGYCWYNNDIANKALYGAMYNWYTVNTAKLCPSDWHVPTDAEFITLEMFLGMTQGQADATLWRGTDQGTQMKNTTGWDAGGNGTNTSGFSALPGGFRYRVDGSFLNLGTLSYWWTSNEYLTTLALYRRLDGSNAGVYREGASKTAGKYVRCVKD
jgi:uncharacterized protein (TIGR02145 family)